MKQITARSVIEVLRWIETTPHHKAELIGPHEAYTHLVLTGWHDRLRIPTAVHDLTQKLVEPSKDRFDTRMYRASAKGRKFMRETDAAHNADNGPATDGEEKT